MSRQTNRLLEDLIWGVRWGFLGGVVFCVWPIVGILLKGESAFEAQGTTFFTIVVAYLMGGVSAGAMVGVLRSWRKRAVGKIASGIIVAVPVALVMRFAVRGYVPWEREDTLLVLFLSVFWGLTGAVVFWKQ